MQLCRQGSFGTFISNTHVNNCLLTEVAQHVRHTQRHQYSYDRLMRKSERL